MFDRVETTTEAVNIKTILQNIMWQFVENLSIVTCFPFILMHLILAFTFITDRKHQGQWHRN